MRGAKILLAVSGLLALGVGAVLLFATKAFMASQAVVVDDYAALIGMAQGSILVGLGAVNLLALRSNDPAGLQAVLGGNLVAQVLGLGVNYHALTQKLANEQVYGDVGVHVVLGVAFAIFIFRVGRPKAALTVPKPGVAPGGGVVSS